jgi:hypothetical protein
MRATIIRPDGTRIEAEGTPEEVARLAPNIPALPTNNYVCLCCGGLLTGVWCPVHGYRPSWPLYPTIFWGAAAANPTTVFLGNATSPEC